MVDAEHTDTQSSQNKLQFKSIMIPKQPYNDIREATG